MNNVSNIIDFERIKVQIRVLRYRHIHDSGYMELLLCGIKIVSIEKHSSVNNYDALC